MSPPSLFANLISILFRYSLKTNLISFFNFGFGSWTISYRVCHPISLSSA